MTTTWNYRYPTSFWQLLTESEAADPNSVIIADDYGRTLTRASLRTSAERVAAALARRGIGQGSVVSWQLPTFVEAPILMMALSRLGVVQNPIVPILREREVGFITKQVETEFFIGLGVWRGFDYERMVRTALGERTVEMIIIDVDDVGVDDLRLPHADPSSLPAVPQPDGGIRWLYYSSGTTAEPKGAKHTDASVIAAAAGLLEGIRYTADDVYPIAWPFSHIGGSTMLSVSLLSGCRLVLFDQFNVAATPERMATHDPTMLGSAVPFFRAFLDAQQRNPGRPLYPSLRVGTGGGAPIPAEIHDEMWRVFGARVVGSWGLTEFPISSCASVDDPPEILATSVGRASPDVQIRVVRADGSIAKTGEEGELRLKGPQCCAGYIDEKLNADGFDAEGWFRTGDLGTVDADGVIRLTGRIKDIIIRNAENISVLEIEDLLFKHPAVAQAAALGLPDARTGERVCAVVVLREGQSLTLEDLRAHCRAEGLAIQKCPEQLEIVDALPMNAMGKVVKPTLRAQILSR